MREAAIWFGLDFVILSEAKDLFFSQRTRKQVLRFAQDDNS